MSKKVLIISSSFRKNGNSETLAKEFEKGALESENDVEILYLRDYEIKYCIGCVACQKTGKCVLNDDVKNIIDKVKNADVLVFATPIYYYCISGQLKTFLDRMNPLYIQDFKYREVYLLASAADGNPQAMDGAIKAIEGWIECFNGVELKGVVRGVNADAIGDIQKDGDLMKEAYTMGKEV